MGLTRATVGSCFSCLLAAALSAQTPVLYSTGDASGDRYGFSVAIAGDVNADGHDDVVIGARFGSGVSADVGTATVLSGLDGTQIWKFEGGVANEEFGAAVAGAGDVDGDGHADVIVGAPAASPNGSGSGRARVFSGFDGSVLHTFEGQAAGDALGKSVSGAGDVDEDGHDDVIVGVPGDDTSFAGAGSATVYSGSDGSVIHSWDGESANDAFGTAVGGGGDADGDCAADLIVGAPRGSYNGADSGRVYVFKGENGTQLRSHDGGGGDWLGSSVSLTGDVNGDGLSDYIAGAPLAGYSAPFAGRAVVYSGANGATLHTLDGGAAGDNFGAAARIVADVNADGFADFAVGSPVAGYSVGIAGRLQVFSGIDASVLHTIDGEEVGERLGSSVDGNGDVNADGYADFIVGSPLANSNGADAGSVRVFAIPPLELHAHSRFDGVGEDELGRTLRGAGDVNNDGVIDYIVGAPIGSYARVLSGLDGSVVKTLFGSASEEFGHGVDILTDINGDGYDEVIIGAGHNSVTGNFAGRTVVLSGINNSQIYQWFGERPFAHVGYDVADAGDVNNDGTADIIVGAWGEVFTPNRAGRAYVFSGANGSELYRFDGDGVSDFLGWAVAAAGDVNGDGYADVIAGAPDDWTDPGVEGPGYARVYSGFNGSTIYTFVGDDDFDELGIAVAGGGDINADGIPDILAGAPGDDDNGSGSGTARAYSGADGSLLYDFTGLAAGDDFGRGVAMADVNADGFADIIVGAPGVDVGGVADVGRAYVFSGQDGALLASFDGFDANSSFAWSVGVLGDADGDNHADFILGAPEEDIPGVDAAGSSHRYMSEVRTDPGMSRTYGPSCPGSNGFLPRIGIAGRPVIGGRFDVELASATPGVTAFACFDVLRRNSPFGAGAPGCVMLAIPKVTVGRTVRANGKAAAGGLSSSGHGPAIHVAPHHRANPGGESASADKSRGIDVPLLASLIGLKVYAQWWVFDSGANALGIATSNGLCVTIGQ